jgi:predicted FMN-binding regulatory protein PaiB
MYVPNEIALSDKAVIAEVVRRYDFALLATAADGAPQASQLPFLFDPDRAPRGQCQAEPEQVGPGTPCRRGAAA